MVRPTEATSYRRRTLLQFAGAAAATGGAGLLAGRGGAQADGSDAQFSIQQGGECYPVTPLSYDMPVEALYEYAYPTGTFEGPEGVSGTSYSSEGTVPLQREQGSIVFLYDGPNGLSLVFVHGRLDSEEAEVPAGDSDAGGNVSFEVVGLPDDGGWVVLDDYYLRDGQQADSNFDRYYAEGDSVELHWAYRGGRTDGGVFRGLSEEDDVRIYPAFNDEAGIDRDYGTVETWEVLSGNIHDPDRQELALDEPVRITGGRCSMDGANTDWADESNRTDWENGDVWSPENQQSRGSVSRDGSQDAQGSGGRDTSGGAQQSGGRGR